MTSAVPPSNCEPFEKRDDGNGGAILARHDGSLKQTERRDLTIELPASAIYGPKALQMSCGHDSNRVDDLERVGCSTSESNRKTHVNQSQDPKASHSFSGSGYLEAWVRVLAMSTMIAYADARALPPHYSSGTGGGSDTASSPNAMENASAPNGGPDPKTHGTSWGLWVTLAIVVIGLLGGAEAWATIRG